MNCLDCGRTLYRGKKLEADCIVVSLDLEKLHPDGRSTTGYVVASTLKIAEKAYFCNKSHLLDFLRREL